MRVTFPVFPGATRAKLTTRWLLAGRGEQRRRQKTGPVLDSETYLATCTVRRNILEEALRACCSLSHTFADLDFLPGATQVIDSDDAMFSSEQDDFFRLAMMLYQRKYLNSKVLVKQCPSLPPRLFWREQHK
jgi:hypothetical protein